MTKKVKEEAPFEAWVERDLGEAASLGLLSEAFARDEVIDQVLDALRASRIPVLVGEPGVGKTAIVHEIVRRAATDRDSPLHGARVVQVSLARKLATLRRATEFGPAFEDFVQQVTALSCREPADPGPQAAPRVVPFVRDLHVAESANVEPILVGLAMRLRGPMLAEANAAAFATLTDFAPELLQWLTPIIVEEPTHEAASEILRRWAMTDERAGGRPFDPRALDLALELSERFLVRDRQPRKALELLGQVRLSATGTRIEPSDVVERFCRQHRVPPTLVDPAQALDLDALENDVRGRILGQPEACSALVHVIAMVKAGLSDLRRPFAAMLFVGPTGVGKTHVAQVLAETLFGRRDRMLRLNLADFGSEHAAATLFGDPAYPIVQKRRGELTMRLSGQPFGVLLLDEIEKAHESVHDRMLQLLDEGCFINGHGETVSCRATIIIATSNAGAELWRSAGLGFRAADDPASIVREVDRRLERVFRFELLNRFDRIVHFGPLSRSDIRTIAARELAGLAARSGLTQRGLHLEADESILDWLVAHGHDPETGARFLRRVMERHVTAAVADLLVRRAPAEGSTIHLAVRDGRPVASLASAPARAKAIGARASERGGTRAAEALLDRIPELLRLAAPRIETLAAQRREHRRLLDEMNAPGFWGTEESRSVLDRYRELDVAVQAGERHASALSALDPPPSAPRTAGEREQLEALVSRAERALAEWTDASSDDGVTDAWVVIGSAGTGTVPPEWIGKLAGLTIAWCLRRGLVAQVVAEQRGADGAVRTVLEVSGPGAGRLLDMERGVHRVVQRPRRDLRLRLDVVPRSGRPADDARARPIRPVAGLLGSRHCFSGRLAQPERGLELDLVGVDREALAAALADLEARWRPRADAEVVRVYGDGGDLARDPRTGVTVLRLKQVLEGRLEPFLEAWRERGGTGAAGG